MKAILIIAALLAGTAHADEMVYKAGDTTVRLQAVDCPHQIIGRVLQEQLQATARGAVVTFQGRNFAACWALTDGKVVILDEDGDGGYIPVTAFVRDQGI